MNRDILLPSGTIVGSYTIVKMLGKGGFGITYLAKDTDGKLLVLKELFISSDGVCRRGNQNEVIVNNTNMELFTFAKNRFVDEASILNLLNHRAIVKVFHHFLANNTAYYAMEYLIGKSLQEYILENGPLPKDEVLKLIFPIFEAVKEMHKKKLWHRDIKPDNMMISGDRTVLIDFGAVKVTDNKIFSTDRDQSLFAAMTKKYAAPEQIESLNLKVDHRADIYALGGTLYYLLAGDTLFEDVQSRLYEESKYEGNLAEARLRNCNCDDIFKKTIASCMEFKKENRPQSINEIQAMLVEETDINPAQPTPIPPNSSSFLGNNWFFILPMIGSGAIAVLLFLAGNTTWGYMVALLFIGTGIKLATRGKKEDKNTHHVHSRFRLLDIKRNIHINLNMHQSYKIGRNLDCDIVVPHTSTYVSREHLLLTCTQSHVYVRELKKTQGTYIDGVKLAPNNDIIWEAGTDLMLVDSNCIYRWESVSENKI